MLKIFFAASGLLFLSAPAVAQSTSCMTVGNMTTCNTLPSITSSSPPGPKIQYDPKAVRPKPCTTFEKLGDTSNYCDAREIAAKRKAALDLLAAGKCSEALQSALGTGDLGFAREVRDFCSAAPR